MKCNICGMQFKPDSEEQNICGNCMNSLDELSNGKGDDEDEQLSIS